MGQTPPPWHGQAVATQILFDHDWPDFDVHRLRMEFSEEMQEVGRFQWKKIRHLFDLIRRAKKILRENPGCILFYPPASAKWIPFLRDVIFLMAVRPLAGATVFIFHASGLPVFVETQPLRKWLGRLIYQNAEMVLEVAQEVVPPHQAFDARSWQWCPCAIEVPDVIRKSRVADEPLDILFVASLQEGKGVLEILRTASLLKLSGRENDFRFRIVGRWFSEKFENEARQMHAELGLSTMVEFTGQLTGDSKWQAYADADVFFFPTHYESEATPIVLMEALGAGLPIITTRWAGIPAMLEGCASALLFPIRSPADYADALADWFQCRESLPEMEKEARDFYQDNFIPERFVGRVAASWKAVSDAKARAGGPASLSSEDNTRAAAPSPPTSPLHISAYLADQNPGHDRSFGISRMSQVVLAALQQTGQVSVEAITSKTSKQPPPDIATRVLPWGTRNKLVRLLTDHFHPLFSMRDGLPDIYYFPKGYLPCVNQFCRPSAVTIHDTIIQYDEDHYPEWREPRDYAYWAWMLKHTLREADLILTVSKSSKSQILGFMQRHGIPDKEIVVTYEPCLYEQIPQPVRPAKKDYVIHLASREPHKRTAQLVRWWLEAERSGRQLPTLHLIGTLPNEVGPLLSTSQTLVKRPFLEDAALRDAYASARALILPSEIEGFGLPALEAYYLGTPVCHVEGTSVGEILSVATTKGRFSLESAESLFSALDEVMAMELEEIHSCGLALRAEYAADKVAKRMLRAFGRLKESTRELQQPTSQIRSN
ncbi:MAG: glycosyltransferase [Luteolibacter sp.]